MSSPNSEYQDYCLYGEVWTKYKTELLLELLLIEKARGRWIGNGRNLPAIISAKESINRRLYDNLSQELVEQRVNYLRMRWRLFDYLIRLVDVRWDSTTNRIYVPAELWPPLHRRNALISAYVYEGDPLYNKLDELFQECPQIRSEDEITDDLSWRESTTSYASIQDDPIAHLPF